MSPAASITLAASLGSGPGVVAAICTTVGIVAGIGLWRWLATGWYAPESPAPRRILPLIPFAVAHGLVWGGLAWRIGTRPTPYAVLPAYATFGTLALALSWTDLDVHRLPVRLTRPGAIALTVLIAGAAIWERDVGLLGRALLFGAAMWLLFIAVALIAAGALGYGDVTLAGIIGLVLGPAGWATVLSAVLLMFVVAGVGAVLLLVTRRANRTTRIAFAPSMVLGALIALAVT